MIRTPTTDEMDGVEEPSDREKLAGMCIKCGEWIFFKTTKNFICFQKVNCPNCGETTIKVQRPMSPISQRTWNKDRAKVESNKYKKELEKKKRGK